MSEKEYQEELKKLYIKALEQSDVLTALMVLDRRRDIENKAARASLGYGV